jgi:hypothetical protein
LEITWVKPESLTPNPKNRNKHSPEQIDPHYCDVILTRWAKYTGKDPVREDGKKWSELNGAA